MSLNFPIECDHVIVKLVPYGLQDKALLKLKNTVIKMNVQDRLEGDSSENLRFYF